MPLLDHFHPPLSLERPWDGFHSAWASAIATQLNQELPEEYFAMPQVTVGGRVEVDVATMRERSSPQAATGNGTVGTAVAAPPRPALSAAVDFTNLDSFEVQVYQNLGGPRLRAAIELVSPSNKDRPSHRLAFAVKCAAFLQRGVAVVVIDIVTERLANLHGELVQLLGREIELGWQAATNLAAVAYRIAPGEPARLECWPETLTVGLPLPTLPLWLDEELHLPLGLEQSYMTTRGALRIR